MVSETSEGVAALKIVAVLATVFVGGRYLLRPIFRIVASTQIAEVFTATALLVVIGTAWLMQLVGIQDVAGRVSPGRDAPGRF